MTDNKSHCDCATFCGCSAGWRWSRRRMPSACRGGSSVLSPRWRHGVCISGYARLPLPGRWLLIFVVLGATAGVYFNYRTIFGRDAGVALLVVMLALKLLETRVLRDGMLLIFLGYFLVITNFLYSQTIPTALYMLACIWVITATMIGLHHTRNEPRVPRSTADRRAVPRAVHSAHAGAVPAVSARVRAVVGHAAGRFFSRHRPVRYDDARQRQQPHPVGRGGVSRAVSRRDVPMPKQLYWRGPVMWDFDGRTWTAPRALYGSPQFTHDRPSGFIRAHARAARQALAVRPRSSRQSAAARVHELRLPAARARTGEPPASATRWSRFSISRTASPRTARRCSGRSRCPPASTRARSSSRASCARSTRDDRALVRAVLAHVPQREVFLHADPAAAREPSGGRIPVRQLAAASASTIPRPSPCSCARPASRRASSPAIRAARSIQLGNYLIVRQADAHAWTEVWFQDEGWVRVDPTAAVSPLRVESGISAAVPRTDPLPLLVRGDFEALRQLRFTWDLMANTWNQWVLGYTPERQRPLLSRVGIDDATWHTLAAAARLCDFVVVARARRCSLLRQLRVRVRDPVKIAYLALLREAAPQRAAARTRAKGRSTTRERLSRRAPRLGAAVVRAFTASVHRAALRSAPMRSGDGCRAAARVQASAVSRTRFDG